MITTKEELIKMVEYISVQASKLSKKIIGQSLSIESLTVFSHSEKEYELLIAVLARLGKSYNFNNGPRVKLNQPIIVDGNKIIYLRIRKPDTERPQVGCCDLETSYSDFKKEYLSKYPDNLRLEIRSEYEMIELHDVDFDVLAYVVSS
jgi:hypothetical protein